MCTFWPSEDQGPKMAQNHPKSVAGGVVSGALWCARTPAGSRDAHLGTRFGRSIGLGEAVMLDKIMLFREGIRRREPQEGIPCVIRPCVSTL